MRWPWQPDPRDAEILHLRTQVHELTEKLYALVDPGAQARLLMQRQQVEAAGRGLQPLDFTPPAKRSVSPWRRGLNVVDEQPSPVSFRPNVPRSGA